MLSNRQIHRQTQTDRQTDRHTDPTTVPSLRMRAEGNDVMQIRTQELYIHRKKLSVIRKFPFTLTTNSLLVGNNQPPCIPY